MAERIYYFSAPPKHLSKSKITRHAIYVKALQHKGIIYTEGQFKRTGNAWIKTPQGFIEKECYEEKESDVNFAISLIRDSANKSMEKALIITNDLDIAPAIRMAKELNPELKVRVITPPLKTGKFVNRDLLQAANQMGTRNGQIYREQKIISEAALIACLLPKQLITEYGEVINRPNKYNIPLTLQ